MNSTKLSVAAFTVTLAALAGSCAKQPRPFCPVALGSPLGFPSPGSPLAFSNAQFALPNFWAKYTAKAGTGACAELPGEEIGFQRFETPTNRTSVPLAIRPFTPSYMRGNEATYLSLDYATYDDTWDWDGDHVIDPAPVLRSDPMDPEGKNLNGLGDLTPDSDAEQTCTSATFTPIDVTFQEEVLELLDGGEATARGIVDGGTVTFPEVHLRYEFDSLKVLSTTEIPGTIFTAQMKYTEGTCTATYDVVGIWPITLCHTDLDCSPNPVGDGPADSALGIASRRLQGSGLNPAYATEQHPLKCNNSPAVHAYTAQYVPPLAGQSRARMLYDFEYGPVYGIAQWGVCEMTRPVADFTAAP